MIASCLVFGAVICLVLSVQTFFTFSSWYYDQYDENLAHILNGMERTIDVDDLQECVETGVPSEKYEQLQQYFNDFLVDYDLAYLEITMPQPNGPLVNIVSATSPREFAAGETDWPLLYEDVDSFTPDEIKPYVDAWEADEITYFETESEWGRCYTACKPLFASDGERVGLLCADKFTDVMHRQVDEYVFNVVAFTVFVGLLFVALLLAWLRHGVMMPIKKLEQSARSFAARSHGRKDPSVLFFEAPDINTKNELESLSDAISQMSEDMHDYVEGLLEAEEHVRSAELRAEGMSRLAFEDSLTKAKSKAAYARKVELLIEEIESGETEPEFAVLMVDLNNLKFVNDTYGHDRGDEFIIGSCELLRGLFRSDVYRVGGDEFVLILEGEDYLERDGLLEELAGVFAGTQSDESAEPWQRYSIAFGLAAHREGESFKATFMRADDAMYANKEQMKSELPEIVKAR